GGGGAPGRPRLSRVASPARGVSGTSENGSPSWNKLLTHAQQRISTFASTLAICFWAMCTRREALSWTLVRRTSYCTTTLSASSHLRTPIRRSETVCRAAWRVALLL